MPIGSYLLFVHLIDSFGRLEDVVLIIPSAVPGTLPIKEKNDPPADASEGAAHHFRVLSGSDLVGSVRITWSDGRALSWDVGKSSRLR